MDEKLFDLYILVNCDHLFGMIVDIEIDFDSFAGSNAQAIQLFQPLF